jgi:ferredoxin-NADP reductase
MLCSAAVDKTRHDIFLFYANRYLEDAAFMDALWDLESSNTNFRFVPTFTRIDGTSRGWQGEIGYIRPEMLSKHVSNLRGPIFYIAGPPTMVAATRRMLVDAGVDEDDIRTEEFAGY